MYNVLLASYTSLKTKGGILVCYYYVEYKRTSIPVEVAAEGQQGTAYYYCEPPGLHHCRCVRVALLRTTAHFRQIAVVAEQLDL